MRTPRLLLKLAPLLLALLFCTCGADLAHAAVSCTFSITNVNFGTIDLTANTTFDTTATFSATCSGGPPSGAVQVCPSINAGSGGVAASGDPRYMLNGTTQLQYNLFQDSSHTTVWGSQFWASAPTEPTITITLNGTGAGTATATIYARVYAAQQTLATGTYTSSFSGTQTQIAYKQSSGQTCAQIGATNVTSAPFTVTAVYSSVCHLASTNLNFGSAGLLNAAVSGTSTLTATCSASTPYTLSLSGGNANATDPTQRKMANGAAQITYGLYQDAAHGNPWGSTSSNWVSGTGSGASQSLTVYGLVPTQTTPAPGTYTDTIVATVSY